MRVKHHVVVGQTRTPPFFPFRLKINKSNHTEKTRRENDDANILSSEYFEDEDEEKEVYGWIFRSDDGFMDTDEDEDEQRRGEKREIWNCVVSEIGAKKLPFDSFFFFFSTLRD